MTPAQDVQQSDLNSFTPGGIGLQMQQFILESATQGVDDIPPETKAAANCALNAFRERHAKGLVCQRSGSNKRLILERDRIWK